MATFDFISHREFRTSLESDHAELKRCAQSQSWKSVQVLAGSIVEALLVDYLVAVNKPGRSKDPLRLELAEAVELCKSENVITARTADLCSVVRSYRNLIHPGRLVRLQEAQPSAESGQIALALVDLIINEVARVRKAAFGLTAEQLVTKIERDDKVLAILRHLLAEATSYEQERLVLDLLPTRYMEIQSQVDPFEEESLLTRASKAYRIAFDMVPEDIKRKATARFVQILQTQDGNYVSAYSSAFFAPADLSYAPAAQVPMLKQHILSGVPAAHNQFTVEGVTGIEPYLDVKDVSQWLAPFLRTLTSGAFTDEAKAAVREALILSLDRTKGPIDEAIAKRLAEYIEWYEQRGQSSDAEVMRELKSEVDSRLLPF